MYAFIPSKKQVSYDITWPQGLINNICNLTNLDHGKSKPTSCLAIQ